MKTPSYPMFAVMRNNYVIDCAFEDGEQVVSPLTKTIYKLDEDYKLIKMTVYNSPAEIGMKYDGNKFYFEGVTNG